MKMRDNVVKAKRFQVKEKSRQLKQLEMTIAEFERISNELEAQIAAEEKRSGITDVDHFAYPTAAKAQRVRRENLVESLSDLASQRTNAELALADAEAELEKAEALEGRDQKLRDDGGEQPSAL